MGRFCAAPYVWAPALAAPPGIVRGIVCDATDPLVAYAVTPRFEAGVETLYVTVDGGAHWNPARTGLERSDTVHVPAGLPGVLLIGQLLTPGAWISPGPGRPAREVLGSPATSTQAFASAPGRIYAATIGSGVLRTR